MNLIPSVKNFTPSAGICCKSSLKTLIGFRVNQETVRQIRRHFLDVAVVCRKDSGCFVEFSSSQNSMLAYADPGTGHDAYVMQISGNAVRIDARDEAGLFYGLQTLFQMPENIPCGILRDEAVIRYRMIHWDLKGYLPKMRYLEEELRILASYKVNAVLLEIEDKYDFRCAPEVGCSGALAFQDMRRLSRLAAALHIMIVPKLQCIAHVDYILKHDRYRHLRENGHCYQFCAVSSDAQKLWNDMADELMECFAEHRQFFHIGADEAMYLGECPECRKLGKAEVYIRKTEQCIDHILEQGQGRRPVIWDDILRNLHHNLTEEEAEKCRVLGRRAVLMYWAYGYSGNNNTFPFLKAYLEDGMTVFGASGFAGCDNWQGCVPPLEIRGRNIDAWTKTAVENHLDCVAATGWTRIASADAPAEPQESSWFTILYAAHSMWSGVPLDFRKFIDDLSRLFYGELLEQELADAVLNVAAHPYKLGNLTGKDFSGRRLAFLRLAAATESVRSEMEIFYMWNQCYFRKLGRQLEDYRIDYMNRWPKIKAEKISDLKKQMSRIMHEFYGRESADEFILSRFGYPEKIIRDTMEMVRKTEKI